MRRPPIVVLLAVLLFTSISTAVAVTPLDLTPNTTFQTADGEWVDGVRCGVAAPSPEEWRRIEEEIDRFAATMSQDRRSAQVRIPVAFHIVRSDAGDWDVTDQQIFDQLDVLNEGFAATNFEFELHSINRVNNTNWSRGNDEFGMKSALAIDPARVLNFYTGNLSGGLLGYAYLPFSFAEDSVFHGVVCLYSSLPGGTAVPYHLGDTGTHEIGHYLGLYHTFDGGCADADGVDDTPAESGPAFGCPVGRDTCPSPGLDPIHNFMNYVDDDCMDEFTPGQSARMDQLMAQYRPTMVAEGLVVDPQIAVTSPNLNVSVAVDGSVDFVLEVANVAEVDADDLEFTVEGDGPGRLPCSWLAFDPASGVVAAGDSAAVTVTVDATGLVPGTYACSIAVVSNDPAAPITNLPIQLDVGLAPELNAFVSTAASGEVALFAAADASGPALSAASAWSGVEGEAPTPVDATITVVLTDEVGAPVVGFPAENIGVRATDGGWVECDGARLTADAPTDAQGVTTISGALAAGGASGPGEGLQVVIDDPAANAIDYGTAGPGLPIRVNSGDLTADGAVTLEDVAVFAADYNGAYAFRSDLFWNGQLDLQDVALLAVAFGTSCNGLAREAPPTGSDVLRLVFETIDGPNAATLERGDEITAHLVLHGPSAREGVRGVDARVVLPDGIAVQSVDLPAGAIDLAGAGSFVVGYAHPQKGDGAVRLASLRLRAHDRAYEEIAAEIELRSTRDGTPPAIAVETGVRGVAVARATLNETTDDTAATVRGVEALSASPNPFNPRTVFRFALDRTESAQLRVYDVAGRQVRDFDLGVLGAGPARIDWNGLDAEGRPVSSGVYLVRLVTPSRTESLRVVLLK